MKPLKQGKYKSEDWANKPVILDSMFREYDLRNSMIPQVKGGKEVEAGINVDGYKALGQAYGTWVKSKKGKKIVVCNDYRSYSRGNSFAFITGVLSTGIDVIDVGMGITPMLYFAQYNLKCEFGAMITASHNDNGWTGVKIAKGYSKTFESEDIIVFKKLVYSGKFSSGKGSYKQVDTIKEKFIVDVVKRYKPLMGKRKLKVVVATGNGGAGVFLPEVFKRLGCTVIESNCTLDWDFPHFNPNPEDIAFLKSMGSIVKKHNADIGVAADGDGDRFGCVDEKGNVVYADRAALAIARFIAKKHSTFVIDVKSTGAFAKDPVLKEKNCNVVFTKTGHSYVKAKSNEVKALAGFEKSGHFFLGGKYGRLYDDACTSSAMFAVVLSNYTKSVSELIKEQPKSYQTPTMAPSVKDDTEKYAIMKRLVSTLKKTKTFAGKKVVDAITINGIRLVLEDGSWALVRASSNQPVLTVVIESFTSKKDVEKLFDEMLKYLKEEGITKKNFDQLL